MIIFSSTISISFISFFSTEPTKITFKFRVMFYTPDPNSLQEYTRYVRVNLTVDESNVL